MYFWIKQTQCFVVNETCEARLGLSVVFEYAQMLYFCLLKRHTTAYKYHCLINYFQLLAGVCMQTTATYRGI